MRRITRFFSKLCVYCVSQILATFRMETKANPSNSERQVFGCEARVDDRFCFIKRPVL